MAKIDEMAKRTGKSISTALRGDAPGVPGGGGGHGGVNSGAMREALVLMREIGSGNWTRVPGSLSILFSRLNLLKYILNPITIGFVAMATAVFFVGKRWWELAEAGANLRNVLDLAHIKFTDQAEAMRKASESAQEFADWLRHVGKAEESASDKMEDTLKVMKERAKLEKELAKSNGATKAQLAQMDINEAKKELAAVSLAAEKMKRQVDKDKLQAALANSLANNPERGAFIKTVQGKAHTMAEVVNAVEDKMRNSKIQAGIDAQASRAAAVAGGTGTIYKYRRGNANDVFDVDVAGKKFHLSLNQAKKDFEQLQARELELLKVQKQLDDLEKNKKQKTEKDIADQMRLERKKKELEGQIGAMGSVDAPGQSSKFFHGHINALQAIGAYTPPAASALVDLNKKMVHHLSSIDRKMGGGSGGGTRGGRF